MANLFGGRDQRGMLQRLRENAAASGMTTGDFASRSVNAANVFQSRPQTGGGLRGGGIGASGGGIADQIAKLDAERNQQLRRTRPGEVAFKSRTYDTQRSGLVDQMKLQGAEAESGLALGMRQQALGIEQERNDITKEDNWLKRLQDPSSLVSAPAVPLATVVGGAQPSAPEKEEEEEVSKPIVRVGNSYSNRARGGRISGPGTGTSDSIPAYLSDGEYVLPAETVDQLGADRLDGLVKRTTGKAPAGKPKHNGLRGYAQGGLAEMYRVNEERAARMGGMYGGGFQRTGPPQPGTINSVGDLWNTPEWAKRAGAAVKQTFMPSFSDAEIQGMQGQMQRVNDERAGRPSDAEIAARTSSGMITQGAPRAPREIPVGTTPGGLMTPEALKAAAGATKREMATREAATPRGMNEELMGLRERMQVMGMSPENNPNDPGAAGLRALRENPVMRRDMNDLYGRMGTGIQVGIGPNGEVSYSGSGADAKANYTGADGKPTADWSRTADYRDAMMRNAAGNDPARQGMMALMAQRPAEVDPMKQVQLEIAIEKLAEQRAGAPGRKEALKTARDAAKFNLAGDWDAKNREMVADLGVPPEMQANFKQFIDTNKDDLVQEGDDIESMAGRRQFYARQLPKFLATMAVSQVGSAGSGGFWNLAQPGGAGSLKLPEVQNIDKWRFSDTRLDSPFGWKGTPSLMRGLLDPTNNDVMELGDGSRLDYRKVMEAMQNNPLFATHGLQALDWLKPRKKD